MRHNKLTDDADRRDHRHLMFCVVVLFLCFGWIAYAIISDAVLENRFGKHNAWAQRSVGETFILAAMLIVTPFIGICGAARLTRANENRLVGWMFLALFAALLLQAVMTDCSHYQTWTEIIRN